MFFTILILFDGLKYTTSSFDDDEDCHDEAETETETDAAVTSEKSPGKGNPFRFFDPFDVEAIGENKPLKPHGPRWLSSEMNKLECRTKKKSKYSILKDSVNEFPGHHPLSPFYADFILPKAVFLIFSILISVLMWILKYPVLFGVSYNIRILEKNLLAITEFVLFLICFLWILFIVQVKY